MGSSQNPNIFGSYLVIKSYQILWLIFIHINNSQNIFHKMKTVLCHGIFCDYCQIKLTKRIKCPHRNVFFCENCVKKCPICFHAIYPCNLEDCIYCYSICSVCQKRLICKYKCTKCSISLCNNCYPSPYCEMCKQKTLCNSCVIRCKSCNKRFCDNCTIQCGFCNQPFCDKCYNEHITAAKCAGCQNPRCVQSCKDCDKNFCGLCLKLCCGSCTARLCSQCSGFACKTCCKILCLTCRKNHPITKCGLCNLDYCSDTLSFCSSGCGKSLCAKCRKECPKCGAATCSSGCMLECQSCFCKMCINCFKAHQILCKACQKLKCGATQCIKCGTAVCASCSTICHNCSDAYCPNCCNEVKPRVCKLCSKQMCAACFDNSHKQSKGICEFCEYPVCSFSGSGCVHCAKKMCMKCEKRCECGASVCSEAEGKCGTCFIVTVKTLVSVLCTIRIRGKTKVSEVKSMITSKTGIKNIVLTHLSIEMGNDKETMEYYGLTKEGKTIFAIIRPDLKQ
eukprot:TRINITY_DN89226_c0_g1_i1.p1 TRINITY_DN89226_c0_g1~~TRINITY_DN89226_c0_g1_i1.p1  ORF type:complete len:507 (-),score=-20.68 TRINITY_DN89226_c0_g1_i1:98-1618(-)